MKDRKNTTLSTQLVVASQEADISTAKITYRREAREGGRDGEVDASKKHPLFIYTSSGSSSPPSLPPSLLPSSLL